MARAQWTSRSKRPTCSLRRDSEECSARDKLQVYRLVPCSGAMAGVSNLAHISDGGETRAHGIQTHNHHCAAYRDLSDDPPERRTSLKHATKERIHVCEVSNKTIWFVLHWRRRAKFLFISNKCNMRLPQSPKWARNSNSKVFFTKSYIVRSTCYYLFTSSWSRFIAPFHSDVAFSGTLVT